MKKPSRKKQLDATRVLLADTRIVIGWREWSSLPLLGIDRIKVKVDTGARSSALHATDIEEFQRDGQDWVRFNVHSHQDHRHPETEAEAPLLERRWVRSSNGRRQLRPVIKTIVTLHQIDWPIELTLTARELMGFRMLLGRQAIRGRFLVDPARCFYDDQSRNLGSEKEK